MALAGYADDDGLAWPSQKVLADDTEFTDRAVRKSMAHLEALGLIEREHRRRKDGSRSSDLVRLKMPAHAERGSGSHMRNVVPVRAERGSAPPERGSGLTTFEPSKEPSEEKKDLCPKRVRTPYPEDFEQFWRAYPTDANMPKKAAHDVWRRMPAEARAKATASVPAFRAHCAAHPDYRPVHAHRFLSQERYEGFASVAEVVQIYLSPGDDGWNEWQALKRTPTDAKGGWWFPSRFPPNARRTGPSDDAWRMVMRDYLATGRWHPAFGPEGGADCPPHIRAEFTGTMRIGAVVAANPPPEFRR